MAQWSENNNQTYWEFVGEFWECFGQPFQNALEPNWPEILHGTQNQAALNGEGMSE